MSEELLKAEEKVNKEFKKVAESIADIHVAFHAVKDAGPMDDLYGLLDDLESTVKKARKGGLIGSGAKGHRKALEEYNELKVIARAVGSTPAALVREAMEGIWPLAVPLVVDQKVGRTWYDMSELA